MSGLTDRQLEVARDFGSTTTTPGASLKIESAVSSGAPMWRALAAFDGSAA